MGCFDSVLCKCPNCSEEIEFQSKAGKCDMSTFFARSVPIEIAVDIENDIGYCENCGKSYQIISPHLPTEVRMALDEYHD